VFRQKQSPRSAANLELMAARWVTRKDGDPELGLALAFALINHEYARGNLKRAVEALLIVRCKRIGGPADPRATLLRGSCY
jgi:hypothetical protein